MSTEKLENIEISFCERDITLPEFIPQEELKNPQLFWTQSLEDYLRNIGLISNKYKKIHNRKAKYYISKYNTAMYTSILLGPLVGMLSAINMSVGDLLVIPIVILCISFLNGILMSIIKFRKWDETALIHKTSAAKYSALATSAQRQLALSLEHRDDPDSYIRWITTIFNKIFITSPIINSDIEKDNLSILPQFNLPAQLYIPSYPPDKDQQVVSLRSTSPEGRVSRTRSSEPEARTRGLEPFGLSTEGRAGTTGLVGSADSSPKGARGSPGAKPRSTPHHEGDPVINSDFNKDQDKEYKGIINYEISRLNNQ